MSTGALAGYADWPAFLASAPALVPVGLDGRRNAGAGKPGASPTNDTASPGYDAATGTTAASRPALVEVLGVRAASAADLKIEREWLADGVRGRELSWWLGFGPRTRAYLLEPAEHDGDLPGVLALHAHGGVRSTGAEQLVDTGRAPHPSAARLRARGYAGRTPANDLARSGFAVLAPDAFSWGSRAFDLSSPPDVLARLGAALDALHRERGETLSDEERFDELASLHEYGLAKAAGALGRCAPDPTLGGPGFAGNARPKPANPGPHAGVIVLGVPRYPGRSRFRRKRSPETRESRTAARPPALARADSRVWAVARGRQGSETADRSRSSRRRRAAGRSSDVAAARRQLALPDAAHQRPCEVGGRGIPRRCEGARRREHMAGGVSVETVGLPAAVGVGARGQPRLAAERRQQAVGIQSLQRRTDRVLRRQREAHVPAGAKAAGAAVRDMALLRSGDGRCVGAAMRGNRFPIYRPNRTQGLDSGL